MRSIQSRFKIQQKKNPYHADYMNLLNAVRAQGFSKEMISRWLTEMVLEEEYGKENRKALIEQLEECSREGR